MKQAIDVVIPVLGQTLQLLVPSDMLGEDFLSMVEHMVKEQYSLVRQGNLFFANEGQVMDYELPLGEFPPGTKLLLM